MAVIYNDKVCIYANELIMYDPKRKVGSEKGFLPIGTYKGKVSRKQIAIARRASLRRPALVEFDSLEVYIQQLYIKYYGDPHEDVERAATSPLERAVGYNEAAYSFFTTYRDGAGKPLRPEKVTLYTLQARVLDAVIRLRDSNAECGFGRGGSRFNVWDRLSEMVNDLLKVRDSKGNTRYPHKLPSTGKTLKRKVDQYEAEGFIALVHKNKGQHVRRPDKGRGGRGDHAQAAFPAHEFEQRTDNGTVQQDSLHIGGNRKSRVLSRWTGTGR